MGPLSSTPYRSPGLGPWRYSDETGARVLGSGPRKVLERVLGSGRGTTTNGFSSPPTVEGEETRPATTGD